MYQGFVPLRVAVPLFAAALVMTVATVPLAAQQASGDVLPERLSLEAAIAYAEQWRPQYRRVLNDEEVANATVRSRQAQYLPMVSASINTNSGGSRRYTGVDFYGNPVQLDEPATYSSSSSTQSINAQFNVFDFGRRESELRAARAGRDAVRADIERERLELRSTVTLLYNEALLAAARVRVVERQLEFSREQLELTERQFNVAVADREAVLGARANVADNEGSLFEARAASQKAELTLAEAIGAPMHSAFVLTDSIPDLSHVTMDVETLVQTAMVRNPLVRAADAQAVAADRRVTAARTNYLPSISAGGSFSRSMNSSGSSAFGRLDPLDQNWGINVGLTIPIFDRFGTGQGVAEARAAREDGREAQRQQRLLAERQVRAYALDVESARNRLSLAREAVELGAERLELAQESFRIGSMNFDQYLLVLERLMQYEQEELTARFTLASAIANLEQVVGERIVEPSQ